jgi:allantoin racemase
MAKKGKKKVLVIVPFPMTKEHLANRQEQQASLQFGPDIEFHYRPVRAAGGNLVSPYDWTIGDMVVLEAGLNAQKEGYDAVCIDTVSDSGAAALRTVLDIPVIGPGRAMFLTAMLLGDKFGVLAMWDRWSGLYKKTLEELGIGHKFVGVHSIDASVDNRNLLSGKEDEMFARLEEGCWHLINVMKADVICLGSTSMHQAHLYLRDRIPVPIINPGPVSYKLAEAILGLGLSQSRQYYKGPIVRVDEMLHAMLDGAVAETRGREAKAQKGKGKGKKK